MCLKKKIPIIGIRIAMITQKTRVSVRILDEPMTNVVDMALMSEHNAQITSSDCALILPMRSGLTIPNSEFAVTPCDSVRGTFVLRL
jgi:hypothetical protein